MGSARAARRRAAGSRARCGDDAASIPNPSARVTARLSAAGLDADVADRRDARQRRQPVSSLAGRVVRDGRRRRSRATIGGGASSSRQVRPKPRPPKRWPTRRAAWPAMRPPASCAPANSILPNCDALVDRAALYIGGDSGPLHIAATTRTPIVALFGPTLPERSMPWRDPAIGAIAVDAGPLPCRPCHQRHCVPGDFRCLTAISPTMVVDGRRDVAVRSLRDDDADPDGGRAAARSTRADRAVVARRASSRRCSCRSRPRRSC